VIYGTNDRYWPIDSARLYWHELRGPSLPLYIPNNGHKLTDVRRILAGLNALHQYSARGRPLPDLAWDWRDDAGRLALEIRAEPGPALVRAWVARSDSRDFREAEWRSVLVPERRGRYGYSVARPVDGYVAVYGEAVFGRGDGRVYLSTLPRVTGPEPQLGARVAP
jgi:PhoPQ-activated pathogenicity-related protein